MSSSPFRFIHASDFHLERPLMGVAEVPDHLRELFLEAPYTAARRVFDAALAEDANFVVLSGGIVAPADSGPRGPLLLAEQFARLAQRGIGVYWAGSAIDPPEAWPAAVKLPRNVHFFPSGQVENLLVEGEAGPLARLVGTSCSPQRPWRPDDFSPDAAGLFTVAVAHGEADPAALQPRGIHYWALGGQHDRSTPLGGPVIVHYCGSPQGRRPQESGVHGCTLVQVDPQQPAEKGDSPHLPERPEGCCAQMGTVPFFGHQARTSLIPTDAARWISQRLLIDESTTREQMEARLRERLTALLEAMPATPLLISWSVAGRGPLLAPLRRGRLAADWLQALRSDYGYRSPPAWSLSMELELADTLPPEWYSQQTIRGEFLRAIRQLQMNPSEPLDLAAYLAEPHRAGALGSAVAMGGPHARHAVLREAAALGADLLGGEEPDP